MVNLSAVSSPLPAYLLDELITLIKQKNRRAFDYLYQNYSNGLFRAILVIVKDEHIAQDILQESFVKIWNNMDKYSSEKGGLYCWMRSIASNMAIDNLRSKTTVMHSKSNKELTETNSFDYSVHPEMKLDYIGLRNVIAKLSKEQQQLINLAYYQGYTFEQIAQLIQKPLGTVKTRMRTTLKVLRTKFNPQFDY